MSPEDAEHVVVMHANLLRKFVCEACLHAKDAMVPCIVGPHPRGIAHFHGVATLPSESNNRNCKHYHPVKAVIGI